MAPKLVHVWLGRDHGSVQKVLVCAPEHTSFSELTCSLLAGGQLIQQQTVAFQDPLIRLYEFRFEGLTPGERYHYQISSGEQLVELGEGLSQEELYFTYWDALASQDRICLVSCNGVFSSNKPKSAPFAMWDRLYEEAQKPSARPQLIVLGGDQYYQDAMELKWMERLKEEPYVALQEEFRRDCLRNALAHFASPRYRKLMAQIPSVAMLDDHDITDGAGGRPEFFCGDEFTPHWVKFAGVQLEMFRFLQASRNPKPCLERENRAFSFALDLGDSALVALDLRSEKNSRKKRLMSEDHQRATLEALKNLPHKNVMILIPLIPIRYDQEREERLLFLAKTLNRLLPDLNPKGWDFLDGIRGLEDDLADVLCSPPNMPFFADMLRAMLVGAARGVRYTILSGDIHAAGSCDVEAQVGADRFEFTVLVSSPIGSKPMPSWLEQLTRERGVVEVRHEDVVLRAHNHQFTTRRNFMMIQPALLLSENIDSAAHIYREGKSGHYDLSLTHREL